MADACAMCGTAECLRLREHPLDSCPIYFSLRDALLPHSVTALTGDGALALFWLARQVGAVALRERRARLNDLVALFNLARADAIRFDDPVH